MASEFLTISDGTFTLSETEIKDQFYFYRNDRKVLTDIEDEPMALYQAYLVRKIMNGEVADKIIHHIYSETSDDSKCIRLTVC